MKSLIILSLFISNAAQAEVYSCTSKLASAFVKVEAETIIGGTIHVGGIYVKFSASESYERTVIKRASIYAVAPTEEWEYAKIEKIFLGTTLSFDGESFSFVNSEFDETLRCEK